MNLIDLNFEHRVGVYIVAIVLDTLHKDEWFGVIPKRYFTLTDIDRC